MPALASPAWRFQQETALGSFGTLAGASSSTGEGSGRMKIVVMADPEGNELCVE